MTDAKNQKYAPKPTGLDLMREPFPPHQILKLPKPTESQTIEVKKNFKAGIRCKECGQWHHPKVVHLDYVGHAALTNRMLDVDPVWNWEPVAINDDGTPKMDEIGGMWIKLTVCGVTRLGYGDAQGKKGPNAVKEVIGDALRNAAMRFGAALDLWHKGDLRAIETNDDHDEADDDQEDVSHQEKSKNIQDYEKDTIAAKQALLNADSIESLRDTWVSIAGDIRADRDVLNAKDLRKAELEAAAKTETPAVTDDLHGDDVPFQ